MHYKLRYQNFKWRIYNNLKLSSDLTLITIFDIDWTDPLAPGKIYGCEVHRFWSKNRSITHLDILKKYKDIDSNKLDEKTNWVIKICNDLENNNFEIDQKTKEEYFNNRNKPYIEKVKAGIVIRGYYLSQDFLEEIEHPISEPNNFDFSNLYHRICLYNWWNILTKEELIQHLINFYFLKSTVNLIGQEKVKNDLFEKYSNKENLIDKIFKSFEITNSYKFDGFIEEELSVDQKSFYTYDLDLYFKSDLLKSLRIWENELRIDNGLKIIGSFFNEDLLFKLISEILSHKYKVISQASPQWLKPQRFDIYIPEINLAIEYQGEQHFRPVDFGGKGEKIANIQFQLNLERDRLKRGKCADNNCELIEVKYNDDIEKFIDQIRKKY